MRARDKSRVADNRDPLMPHPRHREVEDWLGEWVFGGLPQIKELRAKHLFGNRSLLLDQLLSHLPRRHGEIADSRIATGHEVRQSCFSDIPIPDPIQPPRARFRLAVRTWVRMGQNVGTAHLLEWRLSGQRPRA